MTGIIKALFKAIHRGPGPRAGHAILCAILLLTSVLAIIRSISKPFWFDEICTVTVSRLGSNSEIWTALNDAVDTNPPPYYYITRLSRKLTGEDHLGYRLPSTLGILIAAVGLYFFLARRVSPLAALIGSLLLLSTNLSSYASEARPYGLMVGFLSLAALAWQRMENSRRLAPAGFAAALAAAVSVHYYAILVWPAFAGAELALLWRQPRIFRFRVWVALLAGAAPLLAFSGLLLSVRAYYGRNFWAAASLQQTWESQNWLYDFNGNPGLLFALLVFVLSVSLLVSQSGHRRELDLTERQGTKGPGKPPSEELLLAMLLIALPVIAVAVAIIGRGGMTSRYMLPSVLGGCLAAGFLAERLPNPGKWLFLGLLLISQNLESVGTIRGVLAGKAANPTSSHANLLNGIHAKYGELRLPIVISSGTQYLPISYYAPRQLADQLFVLTDPPVALELGRSDSVDLALLRLVRYSPIRVEEYRTFAKTHPEFLLVSNTGESWDWWPRRLVRDGHDLRLLPGVGSAKIFRVNLRKQDP